MGKINIINRKLIILLPKDFRERHKEELDLAITPYVYKIRGLRNEHVLREIDNFLKYGKNETLKLKRTQLSIIVEKVDNA